MIVLIPKRADIVSKWNKAKANVRNDEQKKSFAYWNHPYLILIIILLAYVYYFPVSSPRVTTRKWHHILFTNQFSLTLIPVPYSGSVEMVARWGHDLTMLLQPRVLWSSAFRHTSEIAQDRRMKDLSNLLHFKLFKFF